MTSFETDRGGAGRRIARELAIRRYANLVSWLLAPACAVMSLGWLWFASLLCWGGYPSALELVACRYAYVLPIASGALLILAQGWLLFLYFAFAPQAPGVFLQGETTELLSALGLDRSRQAGRVLIATEMFMWSVAVGAVVFCFYEFEWTIQFAVLIVAVVLRAIYAVGDRAVAGLRSPRAPSQ
jgi:hypothetical protein